MATITLTEFNRNPSRVAKIARTEDVIITDHGVATLELRRIHAHSSRLDQLRRQGQVQPARDRSSDPFPDCGVDRDAAERLFAAFEAERGEREY
jgi:hypothetical protein